MTDLVAQPVSDLVPLSGTHARRLPRLVPRRIRERIAALSRPPIHERESVAQVLGVRRDGRAIVHGTGSIWRGQLVERTQQTNVPGIEDDRASLIIGTIDELGEESRQRWAHF